MKFWECVIAVIVTASIIGAIGILMRVSTERSVVLGLLLAIALVALDVFVTNLRKKGNHG